VKQVIFKSGMKGRGSDRWWERRWWLWWGDMRRMRWSRRKVNSMTVWGWQNEEGSWFNSWGNAYL